MKKFLNLDPPTTLSEKIIWRMLFDRKEIYGRLTDKVGMRNYIEEKGLSAHLPKTYFIGANPRNIPFKKLPKSFVVKPNHASGQIVIVKDKKSLDKDKLIKKCDEWLSFSYYDLGREWTYKNIKAKIVIEELLGDAENLINYKIHCFHGKPKLIVPGIGYTTENLRFGYYDLDWKKLLPEASPKHKADFSRPKNLNKMIAFAAKLSKPFDYVRVDFYIIKDKFVISELTFTPGNGMLPHWKRKDRMLGDLWHLPEHQNPV